MPTWLQMPTWTPLDRWLNFVTPPAFLAAIDRKRERSWWRILLTLALGAVGFFAVSFLGVGVALVLGGLLLTAFDAGGFAAAYDVLITMATPGGVQEGLLQEAVMILILGVMFGMLMLGLLLILRLLFKRPMRTWVTAAPRFRWKLMLAGLILHCGVLTVWILIAAALGDESINPPIFDGDTPLNVRLTYLAIVAISLPIAAAFEEVLCRGWMMQLTGAFTRNLIPLLLVNGLIFSALHMDPDLGRNVSRLAIGMVLSYGALRLGGIEFSIGAHTANNLMIALFISSLSSNLDTSQSTTAGEVSIDLLASLAMLASIELVARWTPLRRWTGAENIRVPAEGRDPA